MSTEINKLNRSLMCRFCLKEAECMNLLHDKIGEIEKIAIETFNIQIYQFKSFGNIICIQCNENIHRSASVKQQILNVQKMLMTQYEYKIRNLGGESPKQGLDSCGFDDGCDESFHEDLKPDLKCKESMDKPAIDTMECGLVGEKHIIQDAEIKLEADEINQTLPSKRMKRISKDMSTNHRKLCLAKDGKINYLKKKLKYRKTDKDILSRNKTTDQSRNSTNAYNELRIIRNNTLKLLTNSNMCPFVSKRTKFSCYSCAESFLEIRQVREHSLSHAVDYELKTDISRCRGMSFKNVDISGLKCKICSDPCVDLNSLRDHLIQKHDVAFGNAGHFLLPFKLEEGFKCVICDQQYLTFNRLSIHMNSHSDRNVCESCGVVYMNRKSLRNHINSIHKEKQCSKCPAVFPTSSAKAKHMRVVHNKRNSKRYCMKCEMIFTYAHQLKEHMIERHGEKRQVFNCEHCGKKFSAAANLRVHVRSVHIGERNYPCSLCDLRFFTSCDKARHEKTHGGGKAFSCDYCEVKFKSKDSQRRHLKRQHGKCKYEDN